MSKSQKLIIKEAEELLLKKYKSMKAMERENSQHFKSTEALKSLFITGLNLMKKCLEKSSFDKFLVASDNVVFLQEKLDKDTLKNWFLEEDHFLRKTNLIIFASECKDPKALEHVLESGERIVDCISGVLDKKPSPEDVDDREHNAFYYTIRSDRSKSLELLLKRWRDLKDADLDRILSSAYQELQDRRVPLSEDMKLFLLKKITDLRFYSTSGKSPPKPQLNNTLLRVKFLVELIDSSLVEESSAVFLFQLKCIAFQMDTLKRLLKATYDRLPWEEMEYCLAMFCSSQTGEKQLTFFVKHFIKESHLRQYLLHFSNLLKITLPSLREVEYSELMKVPIIEVSQARQNILHLCPELEKLYIDYQNLRDLHSLIRIKYFAEVLCSASIGKMEGRLAVLRCLQMIGEHLKFTLQAPKLSKETGELFLMGLPKSTRKVLTDLRNSLSHSAALSYRASLEKSATQDLFEGIQKDLKETSSAINSVLGDKVNEVILELMKKIDCSEDVSEIEETLCLFRCLDPKSLNISSETIVDKLKKMLSTLRRSISNLSSIEEEQIDSFLSHLNLINVRNIDQIGLMKLKGLSATHSIISSPSNIKFKIQLLLKEYREDSAMEQNYRKRWESESSESNSYLILRLLPRVKSDDAREKLSRLLLEILGESKKSVSIKWIKRLHLDMKRKEDMLFLPLVGVDSQSFLQHRLSQLKSILPDHRQYSEHILKHYYLHGMDKEERLAIEMILMDILSLSEKSLVNNIYYLDDKCPVLTGKALRNHLAHSNILVETFFSWSFSSLTSLSKSILKLPCMRPEIKFGKQALNDLPLLKFNLHFSMRVMVDQERLFESVKKGDLEGVMSYLKKGGDLHGRDVDGLSVLHMAVGNIQVLRFLLKLNQLDVNLRSADGRTPLYMAASSGDLSAVKKLLNQSGIILNSTTESLLTPLHIAALSGHSQIVQLLLNRGAQSVDSRAPFSPLMLAVRSGNVDCVKILLEGSVNRKDDSGFSILHYASEFGALEVLKFCVGKNADVNSVTRAGLTPLHSAAASGSSNSPALIEALIKSGAKVNIRNCLGATPLWCAVEKGNIGAVRLLLKNGANPNIANIRPSNATPLHLAAMKGMKDIVDLLLLHRANVHAKKDHGFTCLHTASKYGHSEIIPSLIQAGISVNVRNNVNITPLHLTSTRSIAEYLLKRKADPNAEDVDFKTPIHMAAEVGKSDIIDVLFENGASVKKTDIFGRTPLHYACAIQDGKFPECLLQFGAEVNSFDHKGLTPLHLAASAGHLQAAKILIKHGSDIDKLNNETQTPLHLAVGGSHQDVARFLISKGSLVNQETFLLAVELDLVEVVVDMLQSNCVSENLDLNQALPKAVDEGFDEIVGALISRGADINLRMSEGNTLLHKAAREGFEDIVKKLIKSGIEIDSTNIRKETPLHLAASGGHDGITRVLLNNKASLSSQSVNGRTPLHEAAEKGHSRIVFIFLDTVKNKHLQDAQGRTPVELAIGNGHLDVLKLFLLNQKTSRGLNFKTNCSCLHLASESGSLEIIKYLIDNGADMHSNDELNNKPVHLATRGGHLEVVEYFLDIGMAVNIQGNNGQSLLHFASAGESLALVKSLVGRGADLSLKDLDGRTPLHIAVQNGRKSIVKILLENGSPFNALDKANCEPCSLARSQSIKEVFSSILEMFSCVKKGYLEGVERLLVLGTEVNAVTTEGVLALHLAVKGRSLELVETLLRKGAKTSRADEKGRTALHLACISSNYRIAIALLQYGAVYDAVDHCGKTPLHYSKDRCISQLLSLIKISFDGAKKKTSTWFHKLNQCDPTAAKAVMNARNTDGQTLLVLAVLNEHPEVDELKWICHKEMKNQMVQAHKYCENNDFQIALVIIEKIIQKRKTCLGENCLGILDLRLQLGNILYKEAAFDEALKIVESVEHELENTFRLRAKDAMDAKDLRALILYRKGKLNDSLALYEKVLPISIESHGPDHKVTLGIKLHMALVLTALGRHEEALMYNEYVFSQFTYQYGPYHQQTIRALNNIALVLLNMGKLEEAFEMFTFQDVYNLKKMLFGPSHLDTIRTLYAMAEIYERRHDMVKEKQILKEALDLSKNSLGHMHPMTLAIQEALDDKSKIDKHRELISRLNMSGSTKELFNFENDDDLLENLRGSLLSDIVEGNGRKLMAASKEGDLDEVRRLLELGTDPNMADTEGRRALHYAASRDQLEAAVLLLEAGADPTAESHKGNTPLHTAALVGATRLATLLLDRQPSILDARTAIGRQTALHAAAERGYLEMVRLLLKRGADFTLLDRERREAKDRASKSPQLHGLFNSLHSAFSLGREGKSEELVRLLKGLSREDRAAVCAARDEAGNSLLQGLIRTGRKALAGKVCALLRD